MFQELNRKMKNKADRLLQIMQAVAWVVFVGLLIKAGAILFNYILSINNEEASKNMFAGLNLYPYMKHNFMQYTFIVSYKVVLFATEAYIAYLVAKLLGGLDLKKPFNMHVQKLMQKISYGILNLWIIAILHNSHVRYIAKRHDFNMDLFSSDFIFLAGVIFIFAQIVKRGIDIQSENELTI